MPRTESNSIDLGAPAAGFSLPDAEGIVHRLESFDRSPALLVAFISNRCPFVVLIREEFARLARDYAGRGLAVVAINSNDAEAHPEETLARIGEEVRTQGYVFPYLKDADQSVARAYGAACTPDLFLYDSDRRLNIKDVESFNLGIENSGPALSRGDIDALVESSGVAQKLVDAGQARVLFDAGKQGKAEWSVPYIITANGAFLEKYPDVATRLLEQDIQLAKWVDANPDQTIRIFVEETGNAESSVRDTYHDNVFYQNPEITDAAVVALQGEEAFMASNDLIKGKVDYDSWIDRSYYQAAVEALAQPNTN